MLFVSIIRVDARINALVMYSGDVSGHGLPCLKFFPIFLSLSEDPGYRSRYSDCLRAGRSRGRSSSPGRVRIFSSPYRPDRLLGPPSLLTNGYRGLFPGVKGQGHEADHSPSASAEVKKMWIYTFTPPYAFMA
jgi:hypothetical protein